MSDVNNVLSVALYKKLQKQLEPIVEKLDYLEHATQVIESTPGPQGNRGETGLSGKVGPQGEQGKQGIAGPQGEQGLTGEQGIAGPQGIQGETGQTGPQGETGSQGLTGEQGEQGQTGQTGPRGEQGIEGIAGPQGIQGETGPQGIQGEQGKIGPQGETGQTGQTGPQGIQGEQGKIGPQGKTGQTGLQGIQGLTGERGEQGIQGERGEQGIEGERGEQGIQGECGPQGEQGIQGETGPEGPSGKDAVIPDINDIIDPFIVETKTNIDTYIDRSEKTFKSWQSIVNNQLSSIGGGGEVWLGRLNDIDRVSTKVDGAYLKYNAATKKWVGDVNTDGTVATDLSNHITDETKHLTVEQNTLLDAITVTATEINHLANVTSTIQGQLDGKSAISHGHSTATTSVAGFLSTSDKTKLDAITGTNTGDQTITLGGDASGSGTSSLTVTLANTGVVAGEYNNGTTSITPFTVDAKGRVTATDTPVTITPDWTSVANTPSTLIGYNITDAVNIGETQTIGGAKEFSLSPIVPRPTASNHAVNKAYADDISAGLHVHEQVHVILTVDLATATGGSVAYTNGTDGAGAKLTVTGGSTIITALNSECGTDSDLAAGANGSRVIINGETDNKNWNGIYIISADRELTRAADFDTPTEMSGGDFVFVTHGTTYADTGWVLSEPVTTVGSSNVEFVQFSGQGAYDAGDGLQRDGTVFSVVGTAGRITVGPSVDLATHGTAGTYQSVTTDAYGRITSGSNPTTLSGYGITDAATSSALSNHVSDDARHLTSTQNTLIDGITVTSSKINYLSDVTSAIQSQIDSKSATDHVHADATTSVAGFLSTSDKTKLDAITGTNTGDQTITLTGDVTGSGTGSFVTTLKSVGTAGTYNNSATSVRPFTTDDAGRISSIGAAVTITPAWSSITSTPTTLSGYNISDAAALSGATFTGAVSATSFATPTGTSSQFLKADGSLDASQYVNYDGSGVNIQPRGTITGSTYGCNQLDVTSYTMGIRGLLYGINVQTSPDLVNLHNWYFNPDGTFTFPDNTVQSTAFTGLQSITLTGDVTGSGTGSFTATLKDTGPGAGTYQSVTIDVKGRVTAGTNPTTLSGYGITDAATATGLSTHISDETKHLTSAQNTLIDAITVTSAEINHLTDVSSNIQSQLNSKSSTSHTHDNVTTSVDGFMSAADKTKLNTIASGAEVNVNADWNSVSGDAQILNKPTTLSGYGITDAADNANTIIGLSLFL